MNQVLKNQSLSLHTHVHAHTHPASSVVVDTLTNTQADVGVALVHGAEPSELLGWLPSISFLSLL